MGNGLISYNQSNFEDVEFVERELPVSLVFSQKTKSLITDITTPNSAYGTSYNTYYRNDGSMGERKNFDSVIFLRTFKDGNEYPLMSAVTNKEGGWSIDLANIRDEENKPVSMEGALLEFMPQVDNAKPGSTGYALYEETSFPLKLMGNSEDDWGEDKSEEKELGNLLRKLISKTYAAYCYDVNDNCRATTIPGRVCKPIEGYYGNQRLCKIYYLLIQHQHLQHHLLNLKNLQMVVILMMVMYEEGVRMDLTNVISSIVREIRIEHCVITKLLRVLELLVVM